MYFVFGKVVRDIKLYFCENLNCDLFSTFTNYFRFTVYWTCYVFAGIETKILGPALNRGIVLPWGAQKERYLHPGSTMELDIRPGEFVMRNLFADFTVLAEKKIELVLSEPQVFHFETLLSYYVIGMFISGKNSSKNIAKGGRPSVRSVTERVWIRCRALFTIFTKSFIFLVWTTNVWSV